MYGFCFGLEEGVCGLAACAPFSRIPAFYWRPKRSRSSHLALKARFCKPHVVREQEGIVHRVSIVSIVPACIHHQSWTPMLQPWGDERLKPILG